MNLRPLALALAAVGLAGALTSSQPAATVLSGMSERDAVSTGVSLPRTSGAAYRFAAVLDAKPVRWDPCTTIHWRFNTHGAPTGGATVVRSAVARVAQATRTTWILDGTTTAVPSTGVLPRTMDAHRPIVIGWTNAAHSDLLRGGAANVLGVTRTAWFGIDNGTSRVAEMQAAVIALDGTHRLPLTGRVSWKAVLLHELGHAMGLDHVGTTSQLMYPVLPSNLTDLQSGDLAGLTRLGRSAGCVVMPSH